MFSFIFYSFRRPPRTIFKYTLNDTANNRENLIHASQASSFGTHHPNSTHFVFQPQNNLSELNNNLKIIVDNFSTCSTTRRKMQFERNQTFNLATALTCLFTVFFGSVSTNTHLTDHFDHYNHHPVTLTRTSHGPSDVAARSSSRNFKKIEVSRW